MPGLSTGELEGYAGALGDLWNRLARALTQLEEVAASPEELLSEDSVPALARLQYVIHLVSELALGIVPPPGAELGHAELAAALADARDATAEVVEALESGGPAAAWPLLPEWRGSLFAVRLARMRLGSQRSPLVAAEAVAGRPRPWPALAATLLALAGALTFAGGATLSEWPLWTLGLVLFAAGLAVYRPHP